MGKVIRSFTWHDRSLICTELADSAGTKDLFHTRGKQILEVLGGFCSLDLAEPPQSCILVVMPGVPAARSYLSDIKAHRFFRRPFNPLRIQSVQCIDCHHFRTTAPPQLLWRLFAPSKRYLCHSRKLLQPQDDRKITSIVINAHWRGRRAAPNGDPGFDPPLFSSLS